VSRYFSKPVLIQGLATDCFAGMEAMTQGYYFQCGLLGSTVGGTIARWPIGQRTDGGVAVK
jgi:hypothetical protein